MAHAKTWPRASNQGVCTHVIHLDRSRHIHSTPTSNLQDISIATPPASVTQTSYHTTIQITSKNTQHCNHYKSTFPPHKASSLRQKHINMGFFYSKHVGGRRGGATLRADRHGAHRPIFNFRCCGLNCFR